VPRPYNSRAISTWRTHHTSRCRCFGQSSRSAHSFQRLPY
jgi:hypothetical protein